MALAAGTRRRSPPRSVLHSSLCLALVSLFAGCSSDVPAANDGTASREGRSSPVAAGLDGTSPPPWPAPTDVPERVAAAGLDLGPMGMAEHYHPQLEVIINGDEVLVPANIGVDPATGAMSALHTHTTDGQIHVEADVAGEVFTLGQLFTEWAVKLGSDQIGGEHAKAGDAVTVTSNGEPYTGDPAELRLEPNQQIVVQLN